MLDVAALRLLHVHPCFEANSAALATGMAKRFVAGDCELSEPDSHFLVNYLCQLGEISLAAAVADRRAAQAHPRGSFDQLAHSLRRLHAFTPGSPPGLPAPLWPPRAGSRLPVLSFVHSSASFQFNGYTLRTQAILRHTALDVATFTRIGFPWLGGFRRDREQVHVSGHGGVSYYHRRGQISAQDDHIEKFALAKSEIRDIICEFRPAVVHAASNYLVAYPALLAARACGLPFVYEIRGAWELTAGEGVSGWDRRERFALDRRMETFVAREADRVIALTETQIEDLVGRGIGRDRIDLVPNFFSAEKATKELPDMAALEKFVSGRPSIGYIGSVTRYEGLQHLLQAVAGEDPVLDECAVIIIGDGPFLPELKRLANTLGLRGRVRFTGQVAPDLAQAAYRLIDICVLPRIDAPVTQLVGPLKFIEILGHGRILLTSDVLPLREWRQRTGYGELFRAGDVADLVQQLHRLLDRLPELQERYRAAARLVREKFSWPTGAPLWDAALQRAVADRAAQPSTGAVAAKLRSLTPEITLRRSEAPALLWRRFRAAITPANTRFTLQFAGAAAQVARLSVILIDPETGIGDAPIELDQPEADRLTARFRLNTPALRNVLIYMTGETPAPGAPAITCILDEADGRTTPVVLQPERHVTHAVQLTGEGLQNCELQWASPPGKMVCSVIPLGLAAAGPRFPTLYYSAAMLTRFFYLEPNDATATLDLAPMLRDSAMLELTYWQAGTAAAARLASLRLGGTQNLPQSCFLDLNRRHRTILVVMEMDATGSSAAHEAQLAALHCLADDATNEVFVLTPAIHLPSAACAAVFARPNIARIDPPVVARDDPDRIAAFAVALDRASGGFDLILVQGPRIRAALDAPVLLGRMFPLDLAKPHLSATPGASEPAPVLPASAGRRPRGVLAIAAHDFRSIEPIEAGLLRAGHVVYRQVWSGHDAMQSRGEAAALRKVDTVLCDYCLGNAVWWSHHLGAGQRLIVRFHAEELFTAFPRQVDYRNVSQLIFTSPHIMQGARENFAIPPEICRVVPPVVGFEPDGPLGSAERSTVLGLVGITPWIRRPDRALALVEELHRRHGALTLLIKGKLPTDVEWMANQHAELAEYHAFFQRAGRLRESIGIELVPDDADMASFYRRCGWVLSLSDWDGCDTVVAEAGVMGCIPLIGFWQGAADIYPARHVGKDIAALAELFSVLLPDFLPESLAVQQEFRRRYGLAQNLPHWTSLLLGEQVTGAAEADRRGVPEMRRQPEPAGELAR